MKTIAWIEDDAYIIYDLIKPLEKAGYKIERFGTKAEVLRNVATIKDCDAIIMDVILPPGEECALEESYGGVSVLRSLRSEHNVNIPIVVCTVVRSPDVHRQLKDLGVSEILLKPVLPSKLKEAVERVL